MVFKSDLNFGRYYPFLHFHPDFCTVWSFLSMKNGNQPLLFLGIMRKILSLIFLVVWKNLFWSKIWITLICIFFSLHQSEWVRIDKKCYTHTHSSIWTDSESELWNQSWYERSIPEGLAVVCKKYLTRAE